MRTPNVERRGWAAAIAATLVFLQTLQAYDAAELKSATQPLEDGMPEVAVSRLRELLTHENSDAEKRVADFKLAEALIEARQPEEALKTLDDALLGGEAFAEFLRAQALAALNRWSEAAPLYARAAADEHSAFRAEATFGLAEASHALGRIDDALQVLSRLFGDKRWVVRARLRAIELMLQKQDLRGAARLLDLTRAESRAERVERRFLRGRLEAAQNQNDKAIDAFSAVLKSQEGVTHSVLIATLFALADVHLKLKTPEAGDDALEDFIEHHPSDSSLPAVFAKLDELYSAERKASRNELNRWARDPAQPRQALAQCYIARAELRAGRRDIAIQAFDTLRHVNFKLPEFAQALMDSARLQIEEGRFDEALETLDAARAKMSDTDALARINLLAGEAQYRAKRFEAAAPLFRDAAHADLKVVPVAIYDAALSSLRIGNHAQFLVDTADLNAIGADPNARGDLVLEEALSQAAQGHKEAAATLEKFTREFPTHRRVSEAWVALAELAFHAAPPRLGEARKFLERAMQSQPTSAALERGDYLALWIGDATPNGDATTVVRAAEAFLQKYPQSQFAGEVRMKLAETYFRRQDFANAQTQFELLARENPNAPLTEKALFFAAESALSSMGPQSLDRAIVLLDQVVRKDGELKWIARNEQAAIERKLGKDQDALVLYDEVLKNSGKPAEKREAICGKGDIYTEMAASAPDDYKRAIEMFDQLASDRDTSPHWRNQGLFKKAICLEKVGDRDGALATYYSAIEETARPDRQREFFWYYKAGFSAARLLEEGQKWRPAAAIYEKLASAGGTRSEEAKTRLTRLRLEHFLWDE
jgi:predicted negative regulator of RcsB-dependent stress response